MELTRTLEFTSDANHLVVAQPDRLSIRELATAGACSVAVSELRAFAAVGRELWVATATGEQAALSRFELASGAALSAPVTLPLPPARRARLIAGLGGQVIWTSAPPARVAIDAVTPIPDAQLAISLGATRAITAANHVVVLRDRVGTRWTTALPTGGIPLDGAALFDGRAVAIAFQYPTERVLVVLAAQTGAIQHRMRLPADAELRFASRRAAVLVLSAERRLILIDLRYGRVLVDHELERTVSDLAIDETAQRVALRFDEQFGEVVEVAVSELTKLPTREAAVVEAVLTPPPAATPPVDPEPEPVVEADPFAGAPALRGIGGLPVREARVAVDPTEIPRWLDTEHARAASLAALAIARAWDRGTIAYPDSSVAPFECEVEGMAGSLHGLAGPRVEAAIARLAAAEHAVSALGPSPLDELIAELELSPLAREILRVVAAPQLWGELARLYGILANDADRPLCDELLISTLLADRVSRYAIAAELDSASPLVRSGVIVPGAGSRPFVGLAVDRVALARLRGASPLGELGPAFRGVARTPAFGELRIRPRVVERAVADLAASTAPLRMVASGRPGSGRLAMLGAVVQATGRQVGLIDAGALPPEPMELAPALALALTRVRLAGLVPCVSGLDRVLASGTHEAARLRDVLDAHAGPLAIRLERIDRGAPPALPARHVAIELPPTSIGERIALWERALASLATEVDTAALAARYRVGPGVIARAVATATSTPSPLAVEDRLDHAVRAQLAHGLGAIAHRVERLATWSQVILAPEIQDSLTELVGRIRHRRTVLEHWGFDDVLSTGRGVTALFQGGPGTGKTLVAGAIANELGVELYRIDVSRVLSKWIGETEQNLARLFDAAEDANAVLLFDEADSLFAKRTEVKSSVDRYANTEVNYLLQRLDSFEGIAILTTNFGSSIDSAFKRRLSFRLTFPFPDEEQREQLWRAHIPAGAPRASELDFAELSRGYRISGGYIRNCALRAAFLAAEEGTPIAMEHLHRAIRAEYRENGKLGDGGVLE